MKITKDTVVAIDYTLKDKSGKILDTSDGREPLEYLHGAGNIIAGLEKQLEGLEVGDRKNVHVVPAEGYGVADPALVIEVPRKSIDFPGKIEKGMRFHAQDSNGGIVAFTVVEAGEDKIKLDGNHPLAGYDLYFDVEIKAVRDATPAEIYSGAPESHHSCGCGCGHHHHHGDGECCGGHGGHCDCGHDDGDDDDCCSGGCSCGCGDVR